MENKTEVNWLMYDIQWNKLAIKSCKKCYGRGYIGMIKGDVSYEPVMCPCISKQWKQMSDEERMKYATKKENADELMDKAKELINDVVEEYKTKIN